MSSGVSPWTLPPPLRSKVTTSPRPFSSYGSDLDQQWLNSNSTAPALTVTGGSQRITCTDTQLTSPGRIILRWIKERGCEMTHEQVCTRWRIWCKRCRTAGFYCLSQTWVGSACTDRNIAEKIYYSYFTVILANSDGRAIVVVTAYSPRAGRYGDRIAVEAGFSVPT